MPESESGRNSANSFAGVDFKKEKWEVCVRMSWDVLANSDRVF